MSPAATGWFTLGSTVSANDSVVKPLAPVATGAAAVDSTPTRAQPRGMRRLGPLVVFGAIAVSLFAVAGLVSPVVPLAIRNDDLDRAITGLATGIAAMAAILQWNRFREDEDPAALLLATALLVLAAQNAVGLFVAIAGLQDTLGFSLRAPGQAPIYGWLISRVIAAALFGAAALAEMRGWMWAPRRPALFALGVAGLTIAAFPILRLFEGSLPVLYEVSGLERLLGPEPTAGIAPGMTVALLAANALVVVLLASAAQLHREVYGRTGQRRSLLLSYALFIGAMSQIQFAIVPPSYFGLVSAGDILRVAFYVAVVLVFDADSLSTLRELRLSRSKVEELREAETTQAVLEERSRLAREIHDGLAQELWLAKLRFGRLLKAVGGEQAAIDHEAAALGAAIDSAIAEARLAVIAMNVRPWQSHDLEAALARYVQDVSERLDLPVMFKVERSAPPLSVHATEQILRAVHEALHNVRKHAEASSATVVLDGADGLVQVSVSDDGRGLPPGAMSRGYGLTNMRERVEALGGQLLVQSPGWGTRIVVEVPALEEPATETAPA
jgi:signal transduction histidine kinase